MRRKIHTCRNSVFSGEKQEIQGAVADIQKMDAGNPIKLDVIIRSVRQAKKEKSPRWLKCNIVCKMMKETYVAISISSDLVVLKIYSIVLTFMLPNFGNVTNDGRNIKYLIFVFSNKITVVFCVCLYFVNFFFFRPVL